MEDRVNKPKRKKCPGSGKMSLPVERSYFGGVHHMCPDCGGYVGATEKKYNAPITVRPHMVNVQQESRLTQRPPDRGKATRVQENNQ